MRFNIIKYAPLLDKARTSFWFVPSFMVLSSITLAIFTIYIDAFYIDSIDLRIPLIYATDIIAIRSLLGTIAGAMITVTSIAFSITIVALTLASSQFGPRLLRNFMMDPGTQFVLGSFISNFLFCILIYCAISFQAPYAFKPGVTVIVAVTMTCISVGVLIYFIHHVAKSIQADVVIEEVYQELLDSIENQFPSKTENQQSENLKDNNCEVFDKPTEQISVLARSSGYVQTIDHKGLLKLATDNELVLECRFSPGDFVVKESVIATVYSDDMIAEKMHSQILQHVNLGAYRTPVQDPEFAIHQLVEIALRALSPGINDPYTAITCIDKLFSILCGLTQSTFPTKSHCDQAGILRLTCKVMTFKNIASAATDQIRQQAGDNVAVILRLLESLQVLMCFSKNDEHKQFVLNQTKMIEEQQAKLSLSQEDAKGVARIVAAITS